MLPVATDIAGGNWGSTRFQIAVQPLPTPVEVEGALPVTKCNAEALRRDGIKGYLIHVFLPLSLCPQMACMIRSGRLTARRNPESTVLTSAGILACSREMVVLE